MPETRTKKSQARHPTLLDIAASAGVAPMTVSRVINGTGYVSEEMRTRVQRVIDALEYQPNALARGLKRQRSNVLGILVADVMNPFTAELAASIQEVLVQAGYTCFISATDRSSERESGGLGAFFDHRVEGAVITTAETESGNAVLQKFVKRGMPIVTVGRVTPPPNIDSVNADNWKGAFDAVEHLIQLGHRRIGFIGASLASNLRLRRLQGYIDALKAHGLTAENECVVGPKIDVGPGFSTQSDGYEGMQRLLSLQHRPTAVFARNDYTAIGAFRAIRDGGLRIPEDVAVVGFDGIPLAPYLSPSLTTVEQPTAEQGRRAAKLLLERIGGNGPARARNLTFECRLVVRQSTAGRTVDQLTSYAKHP